LLGEAAALFEEDTAATHYAVYHLGGIVADGDKL
jgi:hypothetical protein